MTAQADLRPGTLDLLILKAVSLGKLHGYGVLLRIEQISGGALEIQQGRSTRPCTERVGEVGERPAGEVLPANGGGPSSFG